MKTTKKTTPVLSRPKCHPRWAWMAGATAAAATTPHTQATTAQISLINNQVDFNSGNSLSFSVTSGHPFGALAFPVNIRYTHRYYAFVSARFSLAAGLVTGKAYHQFTGGGYHAYIRNHANTTDINHVGGGRQSTFALLPFTLTDPNVAAGQPNTNALLEVEAFNQSYTDQTIALLGVFYSTLGNTTPGLTINSTTGAITGAFTYVGSSNAGVFTTPEPTGLALLALGAGGVLARRQRRKAA